MQTLGTLISFARPHTVVATTIQVIAIFLIVVGWSGGPAALGVIALTLLTCLALNLYVVGLNQLTDVDIDRVNKPWLPVAAGTLTPAAARLLTLGAGSASVLLALIGGPFLTLTVALIMLIGSAYSLPPLRLKRIPLAAALSIALARGVIANLGLALHYQQIFGVSLPLLTLGMLGLFFFGFGLVIAIYKDIPDSEGDRRYRIETFTTRLGPQRALNLGRLTLTACYLLPIGLALTGLPRSDALFLLISHAIVIVAFWAASMRVDLQERRSVASFYMFLWGLFYLEFWVLSIYELARAIV